MEFPFFFQRRVNGVTSFPVLGNATDLARPGTAASPGLAPNFGKGQIDDPTQVGGSFVFSTRLWDGTGWPTHRIVVGYHGPASALQLPAALWCYDRKMGVWLQVPQAHQMGGVAGKLIPESLNFFDVVALTSVDKAGTDGTPRPGSAELCLVVQAAGADPDGVYQFGIGGDLTTSP